MELNLKTFNFLGTTTNYFNVVGEGDSFDHIYLDDEILDMHDTETYEKAINFVKNCIHCTCDACEICQDMDGFSFLGNVFAKEMETLSNTYNEYARGIIQTLTEQRDALIETEHELCQNCSHDDYECDCDTCCGDCICDDEEYCAACREAEKASEAVEAVSNTRTFYWAQKYMDTVIDPASELTGPEYNTLLAVFTQYGEWILKQ